MKYGSSTTEWGAGPQGPSLANCQLTWLPVRRGKIGHMTLSIASVNVNGIRAAMRNGMREWLSTAQPDIVTMQEVRAPDDLFRELFADGWYIAHAEAEAKGRAGVAVASRRPLTSEHIGLDESRFDGQGRWVEATLQCGGGRALTIISAYAHTGDEEDPARMEEKQAFFEAAIDRIEKLRADGGHVLLTGDLNIAHREVDLKNWKGNLKKAGFLPEERAHFDRLFDDLGWVDLGRMHGGDGPGPYSWWSYRGKAFDNDAGWRIDYQIASPELAELATSTAVHRAPSYAARWSDHAPVVATFANLALSS